MAINAFGSELADSKSSSGKKQTPVRSINMERAKNGWSVTHRHEEKPAKDGKSPSYEESSKPMLFNNSEEASKHAKSLMDAKGKCPSC